MAQEESHIETDGFKEADSPVKVSNGLIGTSLEAHNEPIETPSEAFGKPTETLAEASCEPTIAGTCSKPMGTPDEQSSEPMEDPARMSSATILTLAGMSGEPTETSAKASNKKSESSKRKVSKSFKAKSKIVKKPLHVEGPKTRSSISAEVSESKTQKKQKTMPELSIELTETPDGASSEPEEAPAEASSEPEEAPAGASSEPEEAPAGASSEPEEAPAGASSEPEEAPAGASSEPEKAPAGASSEPEKAPAGASSEPEEAPAGASREPEETGASSKLGSSEKKMPESLKGKSRFVKKILDVNHPKTRTFSTTEGFENRTQKKRKMQLKPLETPPEQSNGPAETAAKASNKLDPSEQNTPKFLKAKSKIVKKSLEVNDLKTSKTLSASENNKQKKNKRVLLVNIGGGVEKVNLEPGNPLNNILNEGHAEKSPQTQKNGTKTAESEKSQEKKKVKRKRNRSRKTVNAQKNNERGAETERIRRTETKERLGGLIFMCNAKTKPDCFRYRVMGISMAKKDIVLNIKPGLKIFLYDFDLKHLYGIYEASSSGGIKLQPNAFDGKFPAQVRFNVVKDCLPLPENIFKKAIRENYDENNNKFKTELTFEQVRKLRDLFRPAEVHSSALSIRSPPRLSTRARGTHKGVKESLPHSKREKQVKDPHSNREARTYPVHGRDKNVAQEVVPVQREPRDLYLTEREYRAYGLRGDRGKTTHPTLITAPLLDAYQCEYEREHLVRHPQAQTVYRDAIPAQREVIHPDSLYLNDRDCHAYSLGGVRRDVPSLVRHVGATSATPVDSSVKDQYYDYYYGGGSSLNAYPPPQRMEEVPSGSYAVNGRRKAAYLMETDLLQRRETDRVDRLYSTYSAADALADRHRTYHVIMPEDLPAPTYSAANALADRHRTYQVAKPEDLPASTYSAADALVDRHRTYHLAKPEDDLPASALSHYPYGGSYRYR